ncbi:uncharacterized protein LOC110440371, partial [Mizuhopecten yessoensis]|uniref:uncharacterized protein LOC110440371 n=1 Tax=Mizuhopecten yessoensis TaxID=6573 RepID=UPI000B45D4BF
MDEDEGLDMLIAQRSQRPSFARMISWEFNDADETKVVSTQRRQRRRSKQQSGETTQHMGEDDLGACGQDDLDPALRSDMSSLSLEGLSDSDEEFFSAEEFYISDSEPGTGDSVVSASIDGQEEAKCVRNTGEECESDEDRVFTEQNANLNCSSSNIRPSRLSKKQKKKRRKEVCIMYENELRPFMDIEFDDIVPSDRTSVGETLDISKDVPSLVQLCIKSAYKINLKSMPELPNKLKRLFCLDEDFSLQKFQLSWLHSTLSRFEPEEKFADNCMSKDGKDKPAELLHPARNVWNKKYRLNHTPKEYKGSEVSATLPFTILDQASDMGHKRAIITWAVVAATVELMLPPFLSAVAYRHQSESEDDRIVQATRSVMARLKYAMKNRFPTVVSYCFDDVVPYALWARGDLHQATKYFMSLSQSSTK